MPFIRKITLCVFGVATALVMVLTVVVGQQFIEFKSHEVQLHALLEDSEPPQLLRRYIKLTHEKGTSLSSVVAGTILARFGAKSGYRMIVWHPKYFMWSVFVDAQFSQDELYSLYCVLSFNGVDYGAEKLAQRMFNKGLNALSEDEMAAVAAILSSPSRYKNNLPALTAKKSDLISRSRDIGR